MNNSSVDRIDRWLFFVRLFKSRSIAAQAVSGGRVHLNGARVKPSHAVRPQDLVSFKRSAVDFECTVIALPARRGPASEAARCYEEKPESRARREQFAARIGPMVWELEGPMPTLKMSNTLSVMISTPAPQAAQLASLMLVRTLLGAWCQCRSDLHARRELHATRATRGCLIITAQGLARGSAPPW